MRIYRAAHQIVMRFSGMEEGEGMELHGEAENAYKETLSVAQGKKRANDAIRTENALRANDSTYTKRVEESLTKEEQLVLVCEKWPVRYLFALGFIWAVPKIKEYYEGSDLDEDEEDGEMNPLEMMQMMSMWQKMKKFKAK